MNEPAPGFTLVDQQGQTTTLQQFRGKVVVLTFIDPVCTQLCPLATRSMVGALEILGPAAASQVQLLGIDANPLKTKVSDIAGYTRTHELEGRWRFLTGTRAQLESVWKDYHIFVAVENNDIEHTAVTMLIDGNGTERTVFSTPMSYGAVGDDTQALAAGIAQLLPGHPAVASPNESATEPDEPPGGITTVNLTALGPKQEPVVVVGSAHAHLLLFFAGWLGKGPELEKHLSVLDSYAAVAKEKGWPSPVAVDILPTEPSVAEAQQVLNPLAARLQTPIVEDASGSLADDYQVDDLPWFVLNSGSGTILWKHDGWLSANEVKRQVNAALARKAN
jgi:cytochrome oxidase Cu insertion factor (SCO1/SenC/PrrC family)